MIQDMSITGSSKITTSVVVLAMSDTLFQALKMIQDMSINGSS